jgi:hypothetical protein
MSSELETRLAAALGSLRRPAGEATRRARTAALAALPVPGRRSVWPRAALVAAAPVAVLAVVAGALAEIGTLHVRVGPERHARPAVTRLQLPAGARGIAVVAGRRLWLATRGGTRIEALPVSTAELSPHALYVAAGIGRSLVVMAPDGRRAWTRPAAGEVVAISWAPSGLRLAYVVRTAHRSELRIVEGDGDHDHLLEPSVRAVQPSWRADSLALAYVGAGGRAVVADLGRRTQRAVGPRGVVRLAYAPAGKRLAVATARAVYAGGSRWAVPSPLPATGLAWAGRRLFAAAGFRVYAVGSGRQVPAGTRVRAIASLPAGGLVTAGRSEIRIVGGPTLLRVPPRSPVSLLSIR